MIYLYFNSSRIEIILHNHGYYYFFQSKIRKVVCKFLLSSSVSVFGLICVVANTHAKTYGDAGSNTVSGNVTNCVTGSNRLKSPFVSSDYVYSNDCTLVYSMNSPSSVIFEGNVTYDVSNINALSPTSFLTGLTAWFAGELTVQGNYTITGLGAAGNTWAYPQAAMAVLSSNGARPQGSDTVWKAPTITMQGDVSADGGIFFYAAGGTEMFTGTNDGYFFSDEKGSVTVGGKATMHVNPDVIMFYDQGKAALITPINLGDLNVTFNGTLDFDLPLLTVTDGAGKKSVYGAIDVLGSYAALRFTAGGTYTIAQQYQDGLNGVMNVFNDSPLSQNTYWPSVYGWAFVSGNWDVGGYRNGQKPSLAETDPSVASLVAQDMTVNYSMEGAGPTGIWGVVALGQHAQANLTNSVFNLTMQGSSDTRASVFLGGVTLTKPLLTGNNQAVAYYDNTFTLDKVKVDFTGVGSGDYVSVFDVDSSNTVVNVSNQSSLLAASSTKISDRSLIYINHTLGVVYSDVNGNKLPYTTLDFTATDSTLSGGIYVDSVDGAGAFTAANTLTLKLDGSTTWAGDLFVSGTVDPQSADNKASATMTIDGTARWTGMVNSTSAPVTLTIQGQGVWVPTRNVTDAYFTQGTVTLNGGTIQANDQALQFTSTLDLLAGGGAFDSNNQTITFDGKAFGTGALTKKGDGILVLSTANTYAGGTVLQKGELSVSSDTYMGSVASGLTFNGGLLKVTGTTMTATARNITWGANGGGFDIDDQNMVFTVAQNLTAGGKLIKEGSGTLVLSGTNTYTGGTEINAGVLSVAADKNLGKASEAVTIGKASLLLSAAFTSSRALVVTDTGSIIDNAQNNSFSGDVSGTGKLNKKGAGVLTLSGDAAHSGGTAILAGTLQIGTGGTTGSLAGNVANSGKLIFDRSDSLTFSGTLTGSGSLSQSGSGTTILTGAASHTGGTTIEKGTLQIGDGSTSGSLTGGVSNSGVLAFKRSDSLTFVGAVTGIGSLQQNGSGTTILIGNNTYTGGTVISAGTLQIGEGGITGSITGDVSNSGNLIFSRSDNVDFTGVLSGAGSLKQSGTGTLTLSGDNTSFAGLTSVTSGTLLVDQKLGGAITVASGATLGGKGVLAGNVSLDAGGILAGREGQTLIFENNLTLVTGNIVNIALGQSGQTGLFSVQGDLTLAGTINITDIGSFGPGLYRIFDYTGNLTGNTAVLGTVPGNDTSQMTLQTSIANQVNLVNAAGLVLNYWDGADTTLHNNNKVDGGSGTWKLVSDDNWTDKDGMVNAVWTNDQFAILSGTAGTVTIDNSSGAISVAGLQFAADGYRLEGDALMLADTVNNAASVLRADKDVTATIAVELQGTNGIKKTDLGTLILTADNTYTGGTTIAGGTLQLGDGGTTGSITGDVVNDGKLAFKRSDTLTMSGTISGLGGLLQEGAGKTILAGNNTYLGGTTIKSGILQIGDGGTNGTIQGAVVNDGTLAFNRSDSLSFNGTMSGSGTLIQSGSGTTTLTGKNTHSGGTTIQSGTLQIGDGGTSGSLAGDVTNNAKLTFNRSNDLLFNGVVSGTGALVQAGNGRTVLTGENTYNGGTTIQSGILQIGNGETTGSITGNVINDAVLLFNRSDSLVFSGEVSGSGSLLQGGLGTTILTGDSTYSGGTLISAGTLQIGDGGNSGSVTSDIANDGILAFKRSDTLQYAGTISGIGSVVQKGDGTTVFSGNNNYSGGLVIEKGTAKAGYDKTAFGSGLLTVRSGAKANLDAFNVTVAGLSGAGNVDLGNGILTLEQDFDTLFSGTLSGAGGLTKNKSGVLTLSGNNDYSGVTTVNGGTLKQGQENAFSRNSVFNTGQDAILDLNGMNASIAGLSNAGTVKFSGKGGTTITISGNYTGDNGTILLNTVLGTDNSRTDMLSVQGTTAGTSTLKVTNQSGAGARTNNGIKLIEVGGQSDGVFELLGDYKTKDGQQAVVGGAYAYTLHKGNSSGTDMSSWYLRSETTNPGSDPQPRPSAGVPVYQALAATMQTLNKAPTLRQRVGSRYLDRDSYELTDKSQSSGQQQSASTSEVDRLSDNKMIWGRIEGAHNRLQAQGSAAGYRQETDSYIMQAGVDGQFYENDNGRLIGGITGRYATGSSYIYAEHGDGRIKTQAWGLGGTLTWYGDNGFYFDGQLQATWYNSSLHSFTVGKGLAADKNGLGYSLSAEAGKQFNLDAYWSLTPQIQLEWSTVNFDPFDDAWGAAVALHKKDTSLNARLGISADYQNIWHDDQGLNRKVNMYAITNLYQGFLDGSNILVAGSGFSQNRDNLWGGIGAGGTYSWANDKYALYGEGSINTSLQNFADSYTIKGNVGLLIRW